MDPSIIIALFALVLSSGLSSWAAISAQRSSTAAKNSAQVARQSLDVNREGVETAQSVRDRQDRPQFVMTADAAPEHGRWGITIEMVEGPTRVEARWLHQGEVGGSWQEVSGGRGQQSRRVTLVLGRRGGPAYLHKGATLRVAVEDPQRYDEFASIDVQVTITTVELQPGTDDQPTGRTWTHIEEVRAGALSP